MPHQPEDPVHNSGSTSSRTGRVLVHLGAFVLAVAVGTIAVYPDILAIRQSTISTAAVGFIFLPFTAAPAVILALLTYYFAVFALRARAHTRQKSLLYGAVAAGLFVLSGSYFSSKYIKPYFDSRFIANFIAPIPQMSHEQIDQLIVRYPSFPESSDQRIFILNALLERHDLSPKQLDAIAKIQDPALHHKLYSRYGLLGKNRKGLSVARLVALHDNVDASTLSFLGDVAEPYLQGNVASNPKTPVDTLRKIYILSKTGKGNFSLKFGLAANRNTPADILMELSTDSNEYIRGYAVRSLGQVKR